MKGQMNTLLDEWLRESGLRTEEKLDLHNIPTTSEGRYRDLLERPLGQRAAAPLLEMLADFLAGKLEQKPDLLPKWLDSIIFDYRMKPEMLAIMALAPLLNAIDRGHLVRDDNERGPERALKQKIGTEFSRRLALEKSLRSESADARKTAREIRKTGKDAWKLKGEWTPDQCVEAGHWLMIQCARVLNCFTINNRGIVEIVRECRIEVDALRDELMLRDNVLMPHLTPPPDWTGWRIEYDDRLQETVVKDWRKQTKAAIEASFKDSEFEHARGVNNLRRVPLLIDTFMRDLVGRLAPAVMGHDGEQRLADERTVAADIRDANWIGERPFWLGYSCDTRGRVYPNQHLNFTRGDHVRSLIRFQNGMPLDPWEGTFWLEVHCANCHGETDKCPWSERIDWVAKNRRMIENIAAEPETTFDLWRNTDSPFCFAAACRELVAAWKDPKHFETHLPIGFDGSNNGLQHLSLIARDAETAYKVNIGPSPVSGKWPDEPQDVYAEIVAKVIELLKVDKWAQWWDARLSRLEPEDRRKLLKTPAVSYGYGATPQGMATEIAEVHRSFFDGLEPKDEAGRYLGTKIIEAGRALLPGPTAVMIYIRQLAEHCMEYEWFLELLSPTDFPFANRYHKSKVKTVSLAGARRITHRTAVGVTDEIKRGKTLDAAAANVVHSLDAAHLIRSVNAVWMQGLQTS
jgi:DNA-dependent RNA polymerase